MAVGDIWRISAVGTFLGQEYVNTFHFRMKTIAGTPLMAVEYLNTNLYDLLVTQAISNQWSITSWHARQLAVPAVVHDYIDNIAGSGSGDVLPPQSAMVVSLRSSLLGRRHRGRLYLGGWLESAQANGVFGTALVSAVGTYIDDMVAAVGSGGSNADLEWGIWSRVNGGQDPGPYNLIAGWTPIEAGLVRSIVYTQRRRTIGSGA